MRTFMLVCATVIYLASARPAGAEARFTASADIDSRNAYVWRGQILSSGTVLQPALSAEGGGLAGILWANLNLGEGEHAATEFTEVDFTVAYARKVGPAVWRLGAIEYAFPVAGVTNTREVYASADAAPGLVTLSLTGFYDYGEVRGTYVIVTADRTLRVNPTTALVLSATSAWQSANYSASYFGVHASGLGDAGVNVGLQHEFAAGVSATTGLHYTWFWDHRLRSASRGTYGGSSKIGLQVGVAKGW